MKVVQTVFALLILVALATSKVAYDGYEVWRVTVDGEDTHAVEGLRKIIEHFDLDMWASSTNFVDISIGPQNLRPVGAKLAHQRLKWKKMISDLGAAIRDEEERLKVKPAGFSLDNYNTFEDIESYLKDVAASNDYATLRSIGKSVEGRDLWQLKLSVGSDKPAIWLDCNIHAREWITGATCLYGIDYLLKSYGSDSDVTALLDAYDMYIIPIINPDGYSYTWNENRMWRKNRDHYDEDRCYGIDLNRNFDDHFGKTGTSSNSCSDTFRGPSPSSEPETKATQEAIKDLISTAKMDILFSLHSYSQLWLYPYGYTYSLTPNAEELDHISEIGVNALTAVHGTRYVYGPIARTIYPASGNTNDYAYDQGVSHSFVLELRDKGRYGFLLPADQITPTAEETWAGLIAAIISI